MARLQAVQTIGPPSLLDMIFSFQFLAPESVSYVSVGSQHARCF